MKSKTNTNTYIVQPQCQRQPPLQTLFSSSCSSFVSGRCCRTVPDSTGHGQERWWPSFGGACASVTRLYGVCLANAAAACPAQTRWTEQTPRHATASQPRKEERDWRPGRVRDEVSEAAAKAAPTQVDARSEVDCCCCFVAVVVIVLSAAGKQNMLLEKYASVWTVRRDCANGVKRVYLGVVVVFCCCAVALSPLYSLALLSLLSATSLRLYATIYIT